MTDILVIGDIYNYDVTPGCAEIGHSGGSAGLTDSGANDFVSIDGKKIVCINTTHSSNCPKGCTMTITGTQNNYVTINNVLISTNGSNGNMGGCHPTVTVTSSHQNTWININ